ERLLRLDHPSRGASVDRMLRECRELRAGRLEGPGARDAALGSEEDEAQTVEADDTLQLAGQTAEELLRVSAGRDRFGDGEQRLEALHQRQRPVEASRAAAAVSILL